MFQNMCICKAFECIATCIGLGVYSSIIFKGDRTT